MSSLYSLSFLENRWYQILYSQEVIRLTFWVLNKVEFLHKINWAFVLSTFDVQSALLPGGVLKIFKNHSHASTQGCQARDVNRNIVRSHAFSTTHRAGALRRSWDTPDRWDRQGRSWKLGRSDLPRSALTRACTVWPVSTRFDSGPDCTVSTQFWIVFHRKWGIHWTWDSVGFIWFNYLGICHPLMDSVGFVWFSYLGICHPLRTRWVLIGLNTWDNGIHLTMSVFNWLIFLIYFFL
jgi:hypothetical protein